MDAKAEARRTLQWARASLVSLSHRIHGHPEIGFEEERASTWLCEALADSGFAVERGICQMPTAFLARAGSGPLHLAICAEYDSLPGIGHACGHNVIASSAVGAGSALSRLADDLGLTVSVIGTPAEESGGGKILLLERGGFAGVQAALMVHPAPLDIVDPVMLAWSQFDVHYHGKAAHASAFPELGVNALDALTIAQTAIGLLRQHIRPTDRVHGIILKGGDAANVVPAHTSARYMVRAETLGDLDEIQTKVRRCFEAGALATGAQLEMRPASPSYAEVVPDAEIAGIYRKNAEAIGRSFPDLGDAARRPAGSTDMGNVSLAMPAIHPTIGLGCYPVVNHQPEFAAHCATPVADQALFDGALAMAWTAIDLATEPTIRARLTQQQAR
jgi:amidohydrolase